MEIGDEGVNGFEAVAGIDKDARIVAHGMYDAVIGGSTFKGTAGSRTDGNDTSAVCTRTVDLFRAFFRYGEKFAVHDVIGDGVCFDGAERAQTDVEHNGNDLDTYSADLVQQFFREMESCGGCGGGAFFTRIDGLIIGTLVLIAYCSRSFKNGVFPGSKELIKTLILSSVIILPHPP